jgi:hypothetical protein
MRKPELNGIATQTDRRQIKTTIKEESHSEMLKNNIIENKNRNI